MAKAAVVTGSDSGIGRATAVQLAQAGYDLGVTFNRDEAGARGTAREVESHGRRAVVRQLDLSKLPEAAAVIDELVDELGGLDVLVNNSGTSRQAPFLELSFDACEYVPLPESVAYVTAKHGLGGLTKQMALELAEHGITVNAVAPGEVATPMTGNEDVDPRTIRRPAVPLGRPGDAHEIASLVAWLCSDGAAYATGSSFVVDGGLLLMAAVPNRED